MTTPFVIFGLPRSRTAWLSKFLTYGGWSCHHDAMMGFKSSRDLRELLSEPNTGMVETGAAFAWPVFRRFFPDCKFVVIRRPVKDVKKSLAAHNWQFLDGHLEKHDEDLQIIADLPGTLSLTFDDLREEGACAELFEFCLGERFDDDWWSDLANENVQIDMAERMRKIVESSDQIDGLFNELTALISPVTYQVERWKTFHPDCLPLLKAHSEEVGEYHPKMPYEPNLAAGEAMDRNGFAVIVTARAGTALIGYCVFTLDWNLESKKVLCARQAGMFMYRDFRTGGNWKKLVDAALHDLKRRGVGMVYLRHGRRGTAPKMGKFFKRLGAEENGHDYTLWIGEA